MAAARRRRLSGTVAALLLALLLLLPGVVAPVAGAAPGDPGGTLTITSITPVVEGDGSATVRGTLTNSGSQTLEEPTVSVVPTEAGADREEIAQWAAGDEPVLGTAVAATTLDDLAPGDSAPFALTVDSSDLRPGVSAGAQWVSIQTGEQAVHTFIGVHRTKEYEPLGILWGIPLLLPGDRELFGDSGTERTAAWEEAVGQDSRLAALTRQAPEEGEAWLLDPTLLDVPAESAQDTAQESQEHTARAQRAATLRSRLVASRTLVLPEADADVAAGTESDQAARLVTPRVEGAARTGNELGARSDVMWPADGLATGDRAADLHGLRPTGKAPTLLVPGSSLAPSGFTPTGGTRTVEGTSLVVTDGPLSDLVSGLTSGTNLTLARQQLVAETAAVLHERPGTPRTLVVVPHRDSAPSAQTWRRLRDSVADIPWLTKGELGSVLEDAAEAAPTVTAREADEITAATQGDPAAPAVLTQQRARMVLRDQRAMVTFASIRSDGTAWRRRLQPSYHQLTSTRWRSSSYDFLRLNTQLRDTVTLDPDDLVVSSGDVNFFADTGRLQITIINNTDVELSHLTVRLTPGNHFLRIDGAADPVTIGPGGRQTVTVQASALAAGQVPVEVAVTTPGGRSVARPATLHVKVRPTGNSIYWIIGGASVLLLAAGTWRTVRGGRRSATTRGATEESA